MPYTLQQLAYIESVGGEAHQSAVVIIGDLEREIQRLKKSTVCRNSLCDQNDHGECLVPGKVSIGATGECLPFFRSLAAIIKINSAAALLKTHDTERTKTN